MAARILDSATLNGICSNPNRVLAEIFKSGPWSDMTFVIEGEKGALKCFQAHQRVVRFGCKVFDDLLKEKQEHGILISVPDVEQEVFPGLLEFLYTGKARNYLDNKGSAFDLLVAATKYGISTLVEYCLGAITKPVTTVENAMLEKDIDSTHIISADMDTDTPKTVSTLRFKACKNFWVRPIALKTTNMTMTTETTSDDDDDDDYDYDEDEDSKNVQPTEILLERDTWHTVVFNDSDLHLFSDECSKQREKSGRTLDFMLNDGSDRVVKFELIDENKGTSENSKNQPETNKKVPNFIQEIIQTNFKFIVLCLMILILMFCIMKLLMTFVPEILQTSDIGVGAVNLTCLFIFFALYLMVFEFARRNV